MGASKAVLGLHVLLLAVICSLPHWVAIYRNGGDYVPFSVSPSVSALTFDETHAYAPPARRFMSTGKIRAEVDNFERREMSAGIPFIPAAVLGSLGYLFGSLEKAFIAADVIFPPLLFVVFYVISGSLLKEVNFRLLLAWSSVLVPFGLLNSLWMGADALVAPLEITRTPQPEISFLVLTLAAFLAGRAMRSGGVWRPAIASGIASGAIVYCYYFYAVAWGLTLGLMLFLALAWELRRVASQIAIALSLMLLLAVPYAMAAIRGSAQGGQTYLLERMGAYTHLPDWLPLFSALFLISVLFRFGKPLLESRPAYFVLTVLAAGSLFGMNFQIISGYETQRWHFWKRLALPVCFFLVASAVAYRVERRSVGSLRLARRAAQIILIALIVETGARLVHASAATAPLQRASDPFIEMLAWIRSNIPKDHVIGTVNPELILLVPALAAEYTYVPSGLRSLSSDSEIVERYFELACLLDLPPSEVARRAALPSHLGRSLKLLHVLGLTYTGDRAVYSRFVNQYEQFSRSCRDKKPSGRLDYVAVPADRLEPATLKQNFPSARAVYRNARYELLQLH